MASCPSRDVLTDFLNDKLPITELESLESHLTDCDRCRTEMLGLVGDTPQWPAWKAALQDCDDEPTDHRKRSKEPATSTPPTIPGYEITGLLGEGGMGVVYKARHLRLNRLVALKLVQGGVHGRRAHLERFLTEAQAVATLQHPNIVQIYEAGEHDGLPYVALEYVEGGSLQQRLQDSPISPLETASLVGTLARAVQAAHARGIVHRDLKPANILLATDGKPKIADFGLAKRLDASDVQTRTGEVLGTPSYMAPEQATGTPRDIGFPTDVYALGAILYECLTGRPPFKGSSALETLEQVRTQEPVPPSRLQPKTPRDLETICLKSLEKAPPKRYPSAAELADDLRRFQNGEPIRARPTPPWRRLAKWARRRPALATLAATLLLGLATVSALAFGLAKANLTLKHTNEELLQANEAEQRARKSAEEVANFVWGAFESPDPSRDGRTITIAEVLARAAAQIERDFQSQPALSGQLAIVIGKTYHGLGLPHEAVTLLERGSELLRLHLGENDERTIVATDDLANAYFAAGQFDKAAQAHERALEQFLLLRGENHKNTLAVMNNLAQAYQAAGKLEQARPVLEKTLEKMKSLYGEDHPDTLSTMTNLGFVYEKGRQVSLALQIHQEAFDRVSIRLGPKHPQTLATMNNLAIAHQRLGNLIKAEELFGRLLEAARDTLGDDHPNVLQTMANLASVFYDAKRFNEAIPLSEIVIARSRVKLGERHPSTLRAMAGLADSYKAAGQLEKAIPVYEEVLEGRRAKLGNEHPQTLLLMNRIGELYCQLGEFDKAESILRECLELCQRHRPNDSFTFEAQYLLSRVLVHSKHFDEAERLLLQAHEGLVAPRQKAVLAERKPLEVAEQLVKLYEAWGKPDMAAAWRERLKVKGTSEVPAHGSR
jgi:serine/threonine protein kinase/lipopolysaccharide biosynthesis regulator YciM